MKEHYIVTSTGRKKGNAYSSLSRIVQGEKENGDRYSFVDGNNRLQEDEELKLGSIIQYETKRLVSQGNTKLPDLPPKQ